MTQRYAIVNSSSNIVVDIVNEEDTYDPGTGFFKMQSDEADIGWVYNLYGDEALTAPPTVQEMLNLIINRSFGGNLSVSGFDIINANASINIFRNHYCLALQEAGTSDPHTIRQSDNSFIVCTPAQIVQIYEALVAKIENGNYAWAAVKTLIDEEELTDWTLVQAAYDSAFADAAALTRTKLPTFSDIADLQTRVAALEA